MELGLHESLMFDARSIYSGLILGFVTAFFLAQLLTALFGSLARWIAGSGGPRLSLARCLLIIAVVAVNLGVGLGVKQPVVFAFAWLGIVPAVGTIHLIALGLTRHRRRPQEPSRHATRAAWFACGLLGLLLVCVGDDEAGRVILPLVGVAVLLGDVACLWYLTGRRR